MKISFPIFRVLVLVVAMAVVISPKSRAADMPTGFADMVEKLLPAVVNISTTQKVKGAQGLYIFPFQDLPDTPEFEPFREFFERFGQGQKEMEHDVYSLGSGFIVD